MIRASFVSVFGILVIIAGCGPLWSPVPDWLPSRPGVEGDSLPELELPTPPIGREDQPDSGVPSLYAAMFTPVAGTENRSSDPSSETATPSPVATVTLTPRSTSAPPATSPSTPGPAPTPSSVPSHELVMTPGPTATPTPAPQPLQTPVTGGAPVLLLLPERQSIGVGEEIQIDLVLSAAPTGMAGFDIILSLQNGAAAELTGGEISNFVLSNITGMPGDSANLRAVDLSSLVNPGSDNVLLATLRLKGESAGVTGLDISINALDDDSGMRIMPEIPGVEIRVGK